MNSYTIKLILDEVLKQKNVTRYELAKRTGIRYQTIDSYYKNSVKRYDSDVLLKICLVLECDVQNILTISKETK